MDCGITTLQASRLNLSEIDTLIVPFVEKADHSADKTVQKDYKSVFATQNFDHGNQRNTAGEEDREFRCS